MSTTTHIQWTQRTWNPTAGCSKVSAGCDGCYAIRDTRRLSCNPNPKVRAAYDGLVQIVNNRWNWTGALRLQQDKLRLPWKWRKPSRIFVNSMSDLFHESVPDEWIIKVFIVIAGTYLPGCEPTHTFQILTKRPNRMRSFVESMQGLTAGAVAMFAGELGATEATAAEAWACFRRGVFPGVWLMVSCEDQATANERIPLLLQTPAAVRGVSLEPLIGPLDLARVGCYRGISFGRGYLCPSIETPERKLDWVIVGGESGKAARPMHPAWVRLLRDQCQAAGVPFFFKQWGEWLPVDQPTKAGWVLPDRLYRGHTFMGNGLKVLRVGRKLAGRLLDGREWNEYPKAEA